MRALVNLERVPFDFVLDEAQRYLEFGPCSLSESLNDFIDNSEVEANTPDCLEGDLQRCDEAHANDDATQRCAEHEQQILVLHTNCLSMRLHLKQVPRSIWLRKVHLKALFTAQQQGATKKDGSGGLHPLWERTKTWGGVLACASHTCCFTHA